MKSQIANYTIEVSSDSTSWSTIRECENLRDSNNRQVVIFNETTELVKYVRITALTSYDQNSVSIAEILFLIPKDNVSIIPNTIVYTTPHIYQLGTHLIVHHLNDQGTLSLFNMSGREVTRCQLNRGDNNIDITGVSAGNYIIKLNGKENFAKKITIK
jgi:hypothetical protein